MPCPPARRRAWRTRAVVATLVLTLLGSCAWGFRWVTAPPANRAEAESHLERDLLAYARWDTTSVVVFALPYSDLVYIDALHLDPIPMGWPPKPRWQWTGQWAYIPVSSAPASAGYGLGEWGVALFGQVNDPDIAQIRCASGEITATMPVSAPGYAVELPDGTKSFPACDFLDEAGAIIWTTPVIRSEV